ncbi:unnamed protein product [Nezara viridula]|uniref:Gustatory receptor n=1 Tax=Nezara viridula TaxID=85310 RepID=A0A9P0EDK7_NEZVI|nr:unnamed protein product [Nezara viridula]
MFILKTSTAIIQINFLIFESELHHKNLAHQLPGIFSFAHYVDDPTCFIPTISALCLLMKRKKHSKMVKDINMIGESLGISMTSFYSKRLHYLFAIVLLCEIIYELRTEWHHMIYSPCVYFFYIFVYLKWLVIWQLANWFDILRFYFKEISEKLNVQSIEKLVSYHEVLNCCCTTLWECYKIQMSMFVIYIFILFVCNMYLVIDSYSNHHILNTYHYIYLFWAILYISYIWLIVHSCSTTKNMAKKFDKKLKILILNDRTNQLIRNKKIILHLRAKCNVFSSTLGFFNFDYPLLFSVRFLHKKLKYFN